MEELFLQILNMSIAASWLILAIATMRLALKKAPKFILCALWALVGLRLIFPFSIESALSLIPSAQTVPLEIIYSQSPSVNSGIPALNSAVNPPLSGALAPSAGDGITPAHSLAAIAAAVWLVGVAAMLCYALASWLGIEIKLRESAPLRDNIRLCDHIDSAFILGIFRPRIYLPSAMGREQSDYVIAHERAHLKRRDHLWKPLGFALLSVYWFNPLCWLAYWLLCKDIELACDEKVVKDFDAHDKRAYSEALLMCSVPRRMLAACPLAFGEVNVKERIKTVLNYKKPAFWIIIAAVVACAALALCFLTDPKKSNTALDSAIGEAIIKNNRGSYKSGEFQTQAYELLAKVKEGENGVVAYVLAAYMEYDISASGELENTSGSVVPAVISLAEENGKYVLREYKTPKDGALYADSLRELFPLAARAKLSLFQGNYSKSLLKQCDANAMELMNNRSGGAQAVLWFDSLHGDEMLWDGKREISLDEYPGVGFRWSSEKLEAVTETETKPLYYGMPVWSVFFCDLTGDGKPELCSTVSIGSGIVDDRIFVYDYAGQREYTLADRMVYDYRLLMMNGRLCVEQFDYANRCELVATGYLAIEGEELIMQPMDAVGETDVPFDLVYSWVNYSSEGYDAMTGIAENRDTERRYGNVELLTPFVKLDSKADYDAFYTKMSSYFDFERDYDESVAFAAQAERYTEEFFEHNSLFIAYLPEPSCSIRHELEQLSIENGVLELGICRLEPQVLDAAMAGWFIAVGVPRERICGCTGYDAYVCATRDPNQQGFPSGELIRLYAFKGEEVGQTAAVSLYDSGEFVFTFSPLSSYVAMGDYTIESNRLTLNTRDGLYSYVFDMAGYTLVFNAEESTTDMLWFSGAKDGSVFKAIPHNSGRGITLSDFSSDET